MHKRLFEEKIRIIANCRRKIYYERDRIHIAEQRKMGNF